jgi:hypothetical protein
MFGGSDSAASVINGAVVVDGFLSPVNVAILA